MAGSVVGFFRARGLDQGQLVRRLLLLQRQPPQQLALLLTQVNLRRIGRRRADYRVEQRLRIAVNDELNQLKVFLPIIMILTSSKTIRLVGNIVI